MSSTESISPIFGTGNNDTINGTSRSDIISAKAGDDLVYGQNGNDEIWGGSGDDILYGNNGNDVLYGSGGPNYVPAATFTLSQDYPVTVTFAGETAGYRNTFGYYKVNVETGAFYNTSIIWENASLSGSGGDLVTNVSSENIDVSAGETFGIFIVSNGYSYNNYSSLGTGQLEFRNSDGTNATLSSEAPSLWHVSDDDTETQISAPNGIYHTAGYGDDVQVNSDGLVHTVGVMKVDAGTITIGFEDLYGLGDRDFDDSVFTLDIGTANASFINAHYNLDSEPDDSDAEDGEAPVVYTFSDNDTLYGGTGSDELHGKSGNDHLEGGTGADELHGGSGNDYLAGDSGNDVLYGNSGDDELHGGTANDLLYGGSGDDSLYGGSAVDTLHGNSGNDILDGGSGHDQLFGGSGHDQLFGGSGSDELNGNSGHDSLYGGSGSDDLFGGSGDDYLSGGTGADNINGGSGDDFIITGPGRDIVNGGSGSDTVSYADLDAGIRIDLHGKRTTGGDSDSLISIENAIGSDYDDWFRGDLRDNALFGGGGDDILRGTKGEDQLTGGSGADTFLWFDRDLDGSVDSIMDFNVFEGDTLDLSGALTADEGFDITQYLLFNDDGENTTISIDLNGGADDFLEFVTLEGVSGLTLSNAYDSDYIVI